MFGLERNQKLFPFLSSTSGARQYARDFSRQITMSLIKLDALAFSPLHCLCAFSWREREGGAMFEEQFSLAKMVLEGRVRKPQRTIDSWKAF